MTQLETVIQQLRQLEQAQKADSSQKMDAFEGLLSEISTALSDLVEIMERPREERKPDDNGIAQALGAMAQAVRDLRMQAPVVEVAAPNVTVEAPVVNVDVQAPAVKNEVTVQPAAVQLIDRPRVMRWDVKHSYSMGQIVSSTLTPVYEGAK